MAAREIIRRSTDKVVEARHPTDVVNQNPLDNTGDSATCTFKIYDPAKDEIISAAEASAQTVLSVTNAGEFDVDDSVEVTLDNGTLHTSTVSAVDSSAGTITIAVGITDTAAAGNRVRVIVGTEITMTEYGTPDLNTIDWGFRGTFADDHPAHLDPQSKTGFDIDIVIDFVGGPGLRSVETICATIQEDSCS